MAKGRCWPRVAAALRRGSLFSLPASGGRLGDVDRIGGGKAILETLFERPLEPAFADLLPVALGLVVELLLHNGSLRNCHGCPPCERRTGHTGRGSRRRANNAWDMAGVPASGIKDQ